MNAPTTHFASTSLTPNPKPELALPCLLSLFGPPQSETTDARTTKFTKVCHMPGMVMIFSRMALRTTNSQLAGTSQLPVWCRAHSCTLSSNERKRRMNMPINPDGCNHCVCAAVAPGRLVPNRGQLDALDEATNTIPLEYRSPAPVKKWQRLARAPMPRKRSHQQLVAQSKSILSLWLRK